MIVVSALTRGTAPARTGRFDRTEARERASRGGVIVGVLGPLELDGDGRRVGGGRLRALLARLAMDAGRPVPTGRLVDAVWDDELPADQLRAAVAGLAAAARAGRRPPGRRARRLRAARGRRRGALRRARRRRRAGAGHRRSRPGAACWPRREALWRGPALADLTDYRFAVAAAAQLDDRRLTATADRIEAELALGRGDRLVGELEALTAEHPLHERLAAPADRRRSTPPAARPTRWPATSGSGRGCRELGVPVARAAGGPPGRAARGDRPGATRPAPVTHEPAGAR